MERFVECCNMDGSGYTDNIEYNQIDTINYYCVTHDDEIACFTEISEAKACANFASQSNKGGYHEVSISGSVNIPEKGVVFEAMTEWLR